jgi:ribosome assembly protein YihI (activator of Der GTPase)
MPRQKKSRKVGKIGTPKTSTNKKTPTEKRIKKTLGKPAGSRNNESMITNTSGSNNVVKDPRHGSKKPIDLRASKVVEEKSPKIKHFSPAQELAALEQDNHLSSLLDKIDLGKRVSKEEQHFVDKNLARHKILCELLGLADDQETTDTKQKQSDLYPEFDSIDINDFKD